MKPCVNSSPSSALDQACRHAASQHFIEQLAEQIAVTKTPMAILREGRVIWDFVFQTQPAEPAIGQVQVHLFAQSTLGTNAIAVADDQHAHHQFRINLGAPDRAIEVRQVGARVTEIQALVDAAQEVFGRDVIFQIERALLSTR